jgi:hypothetical protein
MVSRPEWFDLSWSIRAMAYEAATMPLVPGKHQDVFANAGASLASRLTSRSCESGRVVVPAMPCFVHSTVHQKRVCRKSDGQFSIRAAEKVLNGANSPTVGVQFGPVCRVRQQMGGDMELMQDQDGTGLRMRDASRDQDGFQQKRLGCRCQRTMNSVT